MYAWDHSDVHLVHLFENRLNIAWLLKAVAISDRESGIGGPSTHGVSEAQLQEKIVLMGVGSRAQRSVHATAANFGHKMVKQWNCPIFSFTLSLN